MKGITRDHDSIAKDYENLFYIMKDQCKKILTLHFMPYIPIVQYVPWVSCVYDIIAAFKLSCKMSRI